MKAQEIIELLEQSLYLSMFPCFYFTIYLDFRTRTYYHGWPLNPQGSELVRELIIFCNQKDTTVTKELDVSASGLQIIGGLLTNIEFLKKTNFLKDPNTDIHQKYDLYSETLKKYLLQKKFYDEDHEKNIKMLLTRKLFKSIIMCYFYNETYYGLICKLKDGLFKLGITLESGEVNKEGKLIRQFLKKEFQDYEFLSSVLNYGIDNKIKNNLPINLHDGNVETFQYYALQEKKRVNYYDRFGKRQKITVSTDMDPLTINKRKTCRSTLPNFIHNIDALLLHSVIRKAREKGVYITVIHDCFIVDIENEEKLKKWYFDSFNYLLLSQDNCLLCSFLKKNLSETGYKEDGIRKIILQIRMKRKAFKLNAYTINPFILS